MKSDKELDFSLIFLYPIVGKVQNTSITYTRQRMEEKMKKTLLLLGTCFCLVLTGCSAKSISKTVKNVTENIPSTSKDDATPTPAVSATPAPKAKSLKLGKKGTTGNWKICVKKAEKKTQIKNGAYFVFKPEKGDQFISITATVRNNGKKKDTFLPKVGYKDKMLTATLYYKDKYEYQPMELLSYDKDLIGTSINPLTSKSGIIVFEVPKKVAKSKKNLTLKIGTESDYLLYSLK